MRGICLFNMSSCGNFVKTSEGFASLEVFVILRSPFWTRSCMKRYRNRTCRVFRAVPYCVCNALGAWRVRLNLQCDMLWMSVREVRLQLLSQWHKVLFQQKTLQSPVVSLKWKWIGAPKNYSKTPEVLFRVLEHPAPLAPSGGWSMKSFGCNRIL